MRARNHSGENRKQVEEGARRAGQGRKESLALAVPGGGPGVFKPSLGSQPAAGGAAKLRGVQAPTPTEPQELYSHPSHTRRLLCRNLLEENVHSRGNNRTDPNQRASCQENWPHLLANNQHRWAEGSHPSPARFWQFLQTEIFRTSNLGWEKNAGAAVRWFYGAEWSLVGTAGTSTQRSLPRPPD